jgi:hypothetical protein
MYLVYAFKVVNIKIPHPRSRPASEPTHRAATARNYQIILQEN